MDKLNEKDQMKVQGGFGKGHNFNPCPSCGSTDIDVEQEGLEYTCTCRKCGAS